MKKTIYITSDHAGHETKIKIASLLQNEGYIVVMEGSKDSENKISYADVGINFAKKFINDQNKNEHLYIALCGSGIGISIALNRFRKIRCARVSNDEDAKLAKLHNDANILCFGGRMVDPQSAVKMFHIWENTEYEGGRHNSRIETLDTIGQD